MRELPSYLATRLFAERVLDYTIPLVPQKVPHATLKLDGNETPYAQIHAIAFASEDRGLASLLLLNRDLVAPHTVTFDLPPKWSAQKAWTYAPANYAQDASTNPVPVEAAPFVQQGARLQVTVSPASLLTVGLTEPIAE